MRHTQLNTRSKSNPGKTLRNVSTIAGLVGILAGCSSGAVPNTLPNKAKFINPAGLSTPTGYTHVVEAPVGRTLYISGQIAFDKQGQLVGPGDFTAQAEQVFANLKVALEASGATFNDVVKLGVYVTDVGQLSAFRTVRDKYINQKNPPASTLVEVSQFIRKELLLEIDAVVVVPAQPAKAQ